ncbi:Gfo/Idh/MocA family protein [Phycisphaera mikurensis]|uniref:Putative oxidoreductase n=1 Tax=Phycisphaera mikurensis (strain NBRC 102666 / KCTC 22515 / FYK2301M01) TaxID=1142394 RepID=I0IGR9_PHYMF|nr:Gfo/Idh/MocA family oxidoreductase [Phycisphaera mikurensis]MBB6443246.1 putative dehydrogenase [Phycisphaera mikurensis]BAM04457.1 putative oxidoreductase [Phycisphaera mikurensis NBRC 102666]
MSNDTIDEPVRWGILGCGGIARKFAAGAADSRTGVVAAVGSRSRERAEAFAAEHAPAAASFGSYEDLIASDAVEGVYVATPHPFHLQSVLAAAAAGKHVMVEKPAGMTAEEAAAMIEACRGAGVFFMEAFKDRPHPVFNELFARVEAGAVGRVFRIETAFGGAMLPLDPGHRLLEPALGGGVILDVGTYAVSMARAIAGAAAGERFRDPGGLRGWLRRGGTGVDVEAGAELLFADGVTASVYCTLRAHAQWIRVHGGEGSLVVCGRWPWHFEPGREGPHLAIRRGKDSEPVTVDYAGALLSHEIDAAGDAIRAGRTEAAGRAMGHADSLGQARTLDRWLACPDADPQPAR